VSQAITLNLGQIRHCLSGAGNKTQGTALVNQIRMLDLEIGGAKKIEVASDFVIDDALVRLQVILG
jgi:mRNA interferase ChpB